MARNKKNDRQPAPAAPKADVQTTTQAPTAPPAATEAAQTATQAAQANGKAMVTVALNRATGIQFAMPDGRKVLINGNAAHLRGLEKGVLPVGGFGLTTIAAEDWEYIKKTYGRMEVFENGLLFAAERKADAVDMADERAALRHGMEPVDPENTATRPNDGKE